VQTLLTRVGAVRTAAGRVPLRITKAVSLERGSATLDIAYLLEGLPAGPSCCLASSSISRDCPQAWTTATTMRRTACGSDTSAADWICRTPASWPRATNGWGSTSARESDRG
jgi:hypothetical protein